MAVRILRIGQQISPPPFLRSGYDPVIPTLVLFLLVSRVPTIGVGNSILPSSQQGAHRKPGASVPLGLRRDECIYLDLII